MCSNAFSAFKALMIGCPVQYSLHLRVRGPYLSHANVALCILHASRAQVVRFWLQHLVKLVGGYPAVALAPGCWRALVRAAAAMLSQVPAAPQCAPP